MPRHQHLVAACLAALICAAAADGDYDYDAHGPATWARSFPQFCAGVKQSPVALSTQSSTQEPLIKKFVLSPESPGDATLTLKNDGHKLELSWNPSLVIKMGINKDDLTHRAAQLHWHWGSTPSKGSEHTLDGKSYAAEGHLVFFNEKDYGNFSNAVDKPNGLAVLGVFYQLSDQNNPLFSALNPGLTNGSLANATGTTTFSVSNFNIVNLFLPSNRDEFFRYEGSLTTPLCYESVLWTVYRQVVPISQAQLDLLKALKFTSGRQMLDNFRPPLPLNPESSKALTPRTVYRTFSAAAGTAASLPLAALAAIAAVAASRA